MRERLAWVDAVKGVCMVLVVLVHVTNKHFLDLDGPDIFGTGWELVGVALTPLRMPLFFAVSGTLAASSVSRPWRDVLPKRVVQPYYLYCLWLVISLVIYQALGSAIDGERSATITGVLYALAVPVTSLWYFYALCLYFVIAKTLSRLPKAAVVASAGAVSVVASSVMPASLHASLLGNMVFFLLGAYFPDMLRRLSDASTPRRAVLLAGAYSAVVFSIYAARLEAVPCVAPVVAFVGICAGTIAVTQLSRVRWFGLPMSYIGKKTLPIYVMHVPLIAILDVFIDANAPWVCGPCGLSHSGDHPSRDCLPAPALAAEAWWTFLAICAPICRRQGDSQGWRTEADLNDEPAPSNEGWDALAARGGLGVLVSCHDSYNYFKEDHGRRTCRTDICPAADFALAVHVGHLTNAILDAGYCKTLDQTTATELEALEPIKAIIDRYQLLPRYDPLAAVRASIIPLEITNPQTFVDGVLPRGEPFH